MAVNLSSNSLWVSSTSVGYPQTISAWFKVSNLSSPQVIAASVRSNGLTTLGIRVETSGAVSAIIRDNTGTPETLYLSTSLITVGVWNHAAAVFTSASSRKVYLNGTLELTDTTTNSASLAQNRFAIGVGGSNTYQFSGDVAEVAQWNASLSDQEVASLGKGAKAYRVRGDNLYYYFPLVRALQELTIAAVVSAVGTTPSVSNHPRVY